MSAIRVNIEIGHEASVRSKKTPEGFTHDWEVFVRGQEGAEISHFVEKVVFKLHETFQKPRRVVKEPPFSIKESGYASFVLPIEIYLKNKDEPKKIVFIYDLTLEHGGFLKDRYIFENPNDEFRRRLLKGGGIVVDKNAFYTNPDQESRSRDSFTDEKPHISSKSKLLSDNVKKHKIKEYKEEQPQKVNNSFENLFGPPIQKPPKVSPDPKKLEKSTSAKSDKKDKDRSSSDKKAKHEHKESKSDKINIKEEKDKQKIEKSKNHSKDLERTKEKASKRQSERPPSPEPAKKKCISPTRKPPSPAPRSSSASSIKEDYKTSKHIVDNFEQKKSKADERIPELKTEKDSKEKKKKEKKSHDRDKERREKKEHKKESHKPKDSPKEPLKELPKEVTKSRDIVKEREVVKNSPVKEKQIKPEKVKENVRKSPPPEITERHDSLKSKDKNDSERKHKHKKKDKKRDESKEKHKESSKDRKHKHEKMREMSLEKPEVIDTERLREIPVKKEQHPIPEPASPISIDTASQCSSKSGLTKAIHIGTEDLNSSHSDSEVSMIADEDDIKIKTQNPSPKPVKRKPSPEPEPEPEPELEPEVEPEPVVEPPPVQQKEKSKKHKDKSKREEKRRKRKAAEEEDSENRKIAKAADSGPSNDNEHGESSGVTSIETKVQDNGVSSSLGEDAEPGDLSPDYMVQLRGLQQRIMTIKNNEDLERVVNLIAETGRYEVTTKTFDFDLCLLDRSTVQQLIQLVGC